MDDEKVEVSGRTFEKKYLENAIKICERDFMELNHLRITYRELSWFEGLKEEELNKLVKHLEEMEDILIEYYTDLNEIMEENNG